MRTPVALSRVQYPDPVDDADVSSKATGGGGGLVPLGSYMEDMRGVWPAADITNGPLLLDPGQTTTAPSLSGMRFVPWSTPGAFNKQACTLVAVPGGYGPTANSACQNVTTDRGAFDAVGIGFPSHTILPFVSDTARIIAMYYVKRNIWGFDTSYHETAFFKQHQGSMKGIRAQPAVTVHGGPDGVYYREVKMNEARSGEWEWWGSANVWLMGFYIDSDANIAAAPNRPLIAGGGNSLSEPSGNVFSIFGGNGSAAGVGFNDCSVLYSCNWNQFRLSTRLPVYNGNQGGTNWVNNNSGIGRDEAVAKGFSVTWSTNQVNNFLNKILDRFPICAAGGNYNDGDAPAPGSGTTLRDNYAAIVGYAFDKLVAGFASKPTVPGKPAYKNVPVILIGGEPKLATAGSPRDYTNQGIKKAGTDRPANFIGFIDWFLDWQGDVTSGLGPDGLHPRVRRAQGMADLQAKRAAQFLVSQAWINAALAWVG